jgi:hypothetical protein
MFRARWESSRSRLAGVSAGPDLPNWFLWGLMVFWAAAETEGRDAGIDLGSEEVVVVWKENTAAETESSDAGIDCVEVVEVWRDNTAEVGVTGRGFWWTGKVGRDRKGARWDMVEVVDTVIVEVAGVWVGITGFIVVMADNVMGEARWGMVGAVVMVEMLEI